MSSNEQPITERQRTINANAQEFRSNVANLGNIESESVRGYALVVITQSGIVTYYNAAPGMYGVVLLGRMGLVKQRLENDINAEEEKAAKNA